MGFPPSLVVERKVSLLAEQEARTSDGFGISSNRGSC